MQWARAYVDAENLHEVETCIADERHGRYREARANPVAEADQKARADQCAVLLQHRGNNSMYLISSFTYHRMAGELHLINQYGCQREDDHRWSIQFRFDMLEICRHARAICRNDCRSLLHLATANVAPMIVANYDER